MEELSGLPIWNYNFISSFLWDGWNFSPEKSKAAADDELDSDEAYNAETDVDDEDEEADDFPPLPDFFAGRVFVLFVDDPEVRKVISYLEGTDNSQICTVIRSYSTFYLSTWC